MPIPCKEPREIGYAMAHVLEASRDHPRLDFSSQSAGCSASSRRKVDESTRSVRIVLTLRKRVVYGDDYEVIRNDRPYYASLS